MSLFQLRSLTYSGKDEPRLIIVIILHASGHPRSAAAAAGSTPAASTSEQSGGRFPGWKPAGPPARPEGSGVDWSPPLIPSARLTELSRRRHHVIDLDHPVLAGQLGPWSVAPVPGGEAEPAGDVCDVVDLDGAVAVGRPGRGRRPAGGAQPAASGRASAPTPPP